MAVRDSVMSFPGRNCVVVTWSGLTGADTGKPISLSGFTDVTAMIYALSTHGSGTTVLQGSNDPRANPNHASHASAIWLSLTDAQGNAISKTADAIEVVEESPLWVRPSQSGGTSANVEVVLKMNRSF